MKLKSAFFFVFSLLIFVSLSNNNANAQLKSGQMGMSVAIGMPSGITPTVSLPNNTLSRIVVSSAATSSFNILVADNFQLDIGFGYLSIAVDEADASNTMSIGISGKYFLTNGEVMPYITGGFSYTQVPTIETSNSTIEGNMLTVLGAFGVQAFMNNSKTIALFIQMGFGYNIGTIDNTVGNTTMSNEQTNLNLGGSAIGATIYF